MTCLVLSSDPTVRKFCAHRHGAKNAPFHLRAKALIRRAWFTPRGILLLLLFLCNGVGFMHAQSGYLVAASLPKGTLPQPARTVELQRSYGLLPLSFEQNLGQAAPAARYISRSGGNSLFLTDTEAVFELSKGAASRPVPNLLGRHAAGPLPSAPDLLRLQLENGSRNPQVAGEDALPGKANYFIGDDPARWRRDVPTYAKVRYTGVYPGIDLVYYGNRSQLEYDFVVDPGSDPGTIRLRLAGATRLRVEKNGDLLVQVRKSEVKFEKPVIYQLSRTGAREPIRGAFVRLHGNTFGFTVGTYDHSKPLVIDPVLVYASYLGGSTMDLGMAIAVDAAGDAYVVGFTTAVDFPITSGAFQTSVPTTNGVIAVGYQGFVTKFNASGGGLIYSTYLGGSTKLSQAFGVAVDAAGDAFVTGATLATDFPITSGAFETSFTDPNTVETVGFVTKLSPTGDKLIYSTYFGVEEIGGTGTLASGITTIQAIAVDSTGDAYVGGATDSSIGFPITPGAFQQTLASPVGNGFVAKLNPQGTAVIYSTYLGGSDIDAVRGIAVNSSGSAYVTGHTSSSNFPVTKGAFQTASQNINSFNAFVTELNQSGSALTYSTFLGGGGDFGNAITVDGSGDAYVTGSTASPNFPSTPGVFQGVNHSPVNAQFASNVFVTKVNPTGSALLYSTFLGGSGGGSFCQGDSGTGIGIDASGNAYVTGLACSSLDFPVTPDALFPLYSGSIFVAEISPNASKLEYSTTVPSGDCQNSSSATGLAIDAAQGVYITGATCYYSGPNNFPVTPGAFQTTSTNTTSATALVAKFNFAATGSVPTTTSLTASATTITTGQSETLTATVTDANGPVGSGTVTFTDNGQALGAAVAVNAQGVATLTTTTLPTSANSLTASYAGNSTDAASTSPAVTVTVNAASPAITFSPASLTFPSQVDGTVSAAMPLVITNSGGTILSLGTISIIGQNSGDFSQTNNCPTGTFAANATCTVQVVYAPSAGASGAESATLQVADTAPNNPQHIALNGTAIPPAVPIASLSPQALTFGSVSAPVASGTTSAPQTVTVTNTGTAALVFPSPAVGIVGPNLGDFKANSTNCDGESIAAGADCMINVNFSPTNTAGVEAATLQIMDNASGSPQLVQLSGIAGPPSSVSCTPPAITITAAGTTTYPIPCTATDFTGTLNFACNLPTSLSQYLACGFSPTSISFATSSTGSTKLTLTLPPASASLTGQPQMRGPGGIGMAPILALVLWLPTSILGIRRRRWMLAMAFVMLGGMLALNGCGGSHSAASGLPPAGAYQGTIVVSGTGLNTSIPFTITVK